jgi:hypothetical protein
LTYLIFSDILGDDKRISYRNNCHEQEAEE